MEIGGVKIEYLGHSGFRIKCLGGKMIYIDPYSLLRDACLEKADIVLITHSHYDHCSIKDIEKIIKFGTIIIVPGDAQSKITKFNDVNMQLIESGDELELGRIRIEAMPAYNIGKSFHTKKDAFLGYVLKIGSVIIYHSGDTDKIPEMEKLTGYGKQGNHFLIFLPVSGTYVMNAEEAAEVVEMLKPEIAIPMHYGAGVAGTIEDAKRFVELCKEKGVHAEILEKI